MTKLRVLKGGPGSGNFGHAGRPGKVGGSAAGTGGSGKQWIKVIEDKQAWLADRGEILTSKQDIDAKWVDMRGSNSEVEFIDFVSSAYEYRDEDTGIQAKITGVIPGKDDLVIYGIVNDADGNAVGRFKRSIGIADDTGMLTVRNGHFMVDKSVRAEGFGRRFYENQEEVAKAVGIEAIELGAQDIGGYAWARMGYTAKYDHDNLSFKVAQTYAHHMDLPGARDFKPLPESLITRFNNMPLHELAAFEVNGARLGKLALLGTDWSGIKYLRDDDPGYQAGRLYYGLK